MSEDTEKNLLTLSMSSRSSSDKIGVIGMASMRDIKGARKVFRAPVRLPRL